MESSTKIVSGIGGRVQLTFQATRMQFTAMLVALLNYTRKSKIIISITVTIFPVIIICMSIVIENELREFVEHENSQCIRDLVL